MQQTRKGWVCCAIGYEPADRLPTRIHYTGLIVAPSHHMMSGSPTAKR